MMKKINISSPKFPNLFTLVDDSDHEELNKYKWYACESRRKKVYVRRAIRVNGKQKVLRMHIIIMGLVNGKEVDHRNGNTLDNQRHNLRHCTHEENIRNQRISSDNTSGYKGVHWDKGRNRWKVRIWVSGKAVPLGRFTCLMKAAKAYDKGAKKYFNHYANPNIKEAQLCP